jgi:chitodextrinase
MIMAGRYTISQGEQLANIERWRNILAFDLFQKENNMGNKRVFLFVMVIAILAFSMSATPAYGQSIDVQSSSPTDTSIPEQTPLSTCSTSTPPSGSYTVTLCFTTPGPGSVMSGDVGVNASVSVTGTNPGVQRAVFYLNSAYLLTDFYSTYSFVLPTTKWQDGSYTIQVEALMRDGYTTANRASISVTFKNGITQPPINTQTFTPTSGTTPPNGSPFIVAATGDGAEGGTNAANVANRIALINPNLFLYLGDVYEKGSVAEFYNWYGSNGMSYSAFLSITDPTIGNHEYTGSQAVGYFDYWNNIPNYYSYNAGRWHFISLNSNSSRIGVDRNSAQYAWLTQDLAANSTVCTIVYYHHPLFNIGPEGPTTAMSDIWALLAQKGVSIVINGHDHDYQRWVALDGNGQPSASGVTEFVAGGGGHGLQTIKGSDSRVAFSDYLNPRAFGVLQLALNSSGASFSYINSSGVTLDSGVIPCNKGGPDVEVPSVPAGLTANAASATEVDLTWQASTDNVGVTGYTIYRDDTPIATVPGSSLSYTDYTALPSTTYTYAVDAFDSAGNHSVPSSPASVMMPAMPSSLTFSVGADTYVNSGSPGSNYGSATVWRVRGSPDMHAYLRFTVQGLAGYSIAQAQLRVYGNTSSSAGINALTVADNTWGEKTVTYTNAPSLGSLLGSSGAYSSGKWVTIDVTPYITGEGTYSFGITTPGSTTLSFAARESGANVAQLVINLAIQDTQAPSVPTGLAATAASSSQVNLAWQASTDNVGISGYTIYRDSALLATVSGSSLTYSDNTVLPSTTYTYTVDAFDFAGNHSVQSSPASVTTPALPTNLTITLSADTYVSASSPTTNYGSATTWRVDGSPDLHAYLRFTVQGLNGNPVQHAYLHIYANSSASAGIDAFTVTDNTWGEKTVTYNNAPPLATLLGASGSLPAATWVTIDVTAYITGDGTYSFGIMTPGSTNISFASKESGVNAAYLVITKP